MTSSIKNGIRERRRRTHLSYAVFISLFTVMTAYVTVLPVFGSHLKTYLGIGDAVFGLMFSVGALAGIVIPLIAEGLLALSRKVPGVSFAGILHVPFAIMAAGILAASFRYRGGKRLPVHEISEQRPLVDWRSLALPWPIAWLACLLALHGAVDNTLAVWMPRFLGSTTDVILALPWHGRVCPGESWVLLLSRAPEYWPLPSATVVWTWRSCFRHYVFPWLEFSGRYG